MEKELFIDYLNNYQKLGKESSEILANVIAKYPYFYSARVLKLLSDKSSKSANFQDTVRQVAALSSNRQSLFISLYPATPINLSKSSSLEPTPNENFQDNDQSIEPQGSLDHEQDSNKVLSDSISHEQESLSDNNENNLLELSDVTFEQHHKSDEEVYMGPQLYTLEIPNGSLDEEGYLTLTTAGNDQISKEKGIPEADKSILELMDEEQSNPIEILPVEDEVPNQIKLIDAFIESNPRIVPKQAPGETPIEQEDISLESLKEPEDAVSESLANIYIIQKHYDKAIRIYEKLCLKYPEKRVYFAGQIEKLRNQSDK
jgi:hypothetical protein